MDDIANKIIPGMPNGIHPAASGIFSFGNTLLTQDMLRTQAVQAAQNARVVNPLLDIVRGIPSNLGHQMPFPPRSGVPPLAFAGSRAGPTLNFFGSLLRSQMNTVGKK